MDWEARKVQRNGKQMFCFIRDSNPGVLDQSPTLYQLASKQRNVWMTRPGLELGCAGPKSDALPVLHKIEKCYVSSNSNMSLNYARGGTHPSSVIMGGTQVV